MSEDLQKYDLADPLTTMSRHREVVKLQSQELICCPYCDRSKLVMQTAELRNGIVMSYSGMFADYYCRDCDKMATLGFFNQPLNGDDMAARINWVLPRREP